MLLQKKAAIILEGKKLTEGLAKEVRYALGATEVQRFYTAPIEKGGLGQNVQRFSQVDFRVQDKAMAGKPKGLGL